METANNEEKKCIMQSLHYNTKHLPIQSQSKNLFIVRQSLKPFTR